MVETAAQPSTPHGNARFAGAAYAVVVVTGVFSLAYAPSQIFSGATDVEIAQSVAAHEGLLRASIAAELTCYVAFLVLALALHRLFRPTDAFAAALMAALVLASVPLGCANVANALAMLRTDDASAIAEARGRYSDGIHIIKIFWGGWLIPFGYLVIRSGFLPRILGVVLILAGIGYLADFASQLFWADYDDSGLGRLLRAPRIGEMAIAFWLLAFGARRMFLP